MVLNLTVGRNGYVNLIFLRCWFCSNILLVILVLYSLVFFINTILEE